MKRFAIFFVLCIAAAVVISGCGKSKVDRAEELIKMGSKAEAVKLLSEEISDNPKNADAYFVYGKALLVDDKQGAYDKFRSAFRADSGTKDKIVELVKSNLNDYSDISFIAEIDPELIKTDADLYYKYRVEMAPDISSASTFADSFPKDPRAPKAIEVQADCYKDGGSTDAAKDLYQRLAKEYPSSSEGNKAKRLLADWWNKHTINLPVDVKWHPFSLKKGQKYRYSVRGEVRKETGLGLLRLSGDDVFTFIGTQAELHTSQRNSLFTGSYFDYYTGPKARKTGSYGSGVAPKDCSIWFYIDCAMEVDDSLSVDVEVKE